MHVKFFMSMRSSVAACCLKLDAFILFSFYQAAILAKERRQAWSNIVATLRIVANVQGNARGIYGRLVGQYVISRSIGLKPGGNCLPVHQGLLCIQSQ